MSHDLAPPGLPRALGLGDLILLMLVAIVNISLVPSVTLHGGATLWLWALAFLAFFVPQGVAVLTLARRYPGEGGVYLWARELFGETHGFLSGWCYWTNNLFYIPMQLVYLTSVLAFASRSSAWALSTSKWFIAGGAGSWLLVMTVTNMLGLRIGKRVQNAGAIATAVTALTFIAVALLAPPVEAPVGPPASMFRLDALSTFSVMCLAFVGAELASAMGNEICRPERDLRPALFISGALALALYLAVTVALLRVTPPGESGSIQGVMEAIARGADSAGVGGWVAPMALLLSLSVGGSLSAWFAGAARIPFVAGLDRALPLQLGHLHPRWGSPHVALGVQALVAAGLLALTLAGSTINEAYEIFLKTTVVIQMIPFGYMFAGLVKLPGLGRLTRAAGILGLVTTTFSAVVAFVPGPEVTDPLIFEGKMLAGCAVTLGGGFLMFARRRYRGVSTPAGTPA
jgi:glutamate:GABA antiporter